MGGSHVRSQGSSSLRSSSNSHRLARAKVNIWGRTPQVGAEASAPSTVVAAAQCGGAAQRQNRTMKPAVVTIDENTIKPAHPAVRQIPNKSNSESHSCAIHGTPFLVNENGSAWGTARFSTIHCPVRRCHHR